MKTSAAEQVQTIAELRQELAESLERESTTAGENVRLFKELQERNTELREALEHQAATAEVLSIISRSPTDVQPVLDAIVESAARVCGIDDVLLRLHEGNHAVPRAHFGAIPIGRVEISIDEPQYRLIREQGTLHVPDVGAQNDFPMLGVLGRWRTFLGVPLRQQGEFVGTLNARRSEVRPFTLAQIKLLETFADQAVIAIENVRLFQELTESLEQQTATSEILGVIASSPTDIQPVLNVIAENAGRICGMPDVAIFRTEDDGYRIVATYGSAPVQAAGEIRPLDRGSVAGRAMVDRQIIHIHDVRAVQDDFWRVRTGAVPEGLRTLLAIPLVRESTPIGAIVMRRTEVQPFTDKQIALLKTFADQAVIAIENVRLFKELSARNAELREALEHQTATSKILGVIASSPTDVQPVLDVVAESAARLCDAFNTVVYRVVDDDLHVVAQYGPIPAPARILPMSRGLPTGRAVIDRQAIHVHDITTEIDTEFPQSPSRLTGKPSTTRTILAMPLLREGVPIGVIVIRRQEVRPFSEKQIKLLETFGDQAVIAIENVRLFNELKEALEQQTATSEILGVIASSPTNVQPVLDVVAENAARLCDATNAQVFRFNGSVLRLVANHGGVPSSTEAPIRRSSPLGRIFVDRKTLHVHDLVAELETEFPDAKASQERLGHRTILGTPLLREGVPVGVIGLRRTEVRPFTDKQIKLLETFAAQAVIAIENVRLFKELGERNAELHEALEHQTATAEVLSIISRSPTDVQPVLDAIVESAARVCGIDDVVLRLLEGNVMAVRAHVGAVPIAAGRMEISIDESHFGWIREHGALHIPDIRAQRTDFPALGSSRGVSRTFLIVPLRQQGQLIGTLNARRIEVRPFTPAQIKLLETFADQAVIAIENVRLFKELQVRNRDLTEALEQQTATSEILRVIASSPTDIQPVLDVVAENAARLCDAIDAVIHRIDGDKLRSGARYGLLPTRRGSEPLTSIDRGSIPGRTVVDR
ncbi:MAG TPA: GAF domain-containing protein, partial [Candidatus Udaeobacter sp.]|nr:GAF domain-containing protein [Candidatus Udaeobacter sp.]